MWLDYLQNCSSKALTETMRVSKSFRAASAASSAEKAREINGGRDESLRKAMFSGMSELSAAAAAIDCTDWNT